MSERYVSDRTPEPDIIVANHGTIWMLRPLTTVGVRWLRDYAHAEGWQWHQGALACDPRYAIVIVEAMQEDGIGVKAA